MNNKQNYFGILILVIAMIAFAGCEKDADPVPNATQKLSIHLHTNVGNTEADYVTTFSDGSGRKFTLSDCRYYLSNLVLIKSDGSELPLTDIVLLVNPADQDYELTDVPVGDYKGIKMLFGLDSVTNHTDPAIYPAGDPLAIQTPGFHWDWNSGYIFLKMEGLCDTTIAGNGVADYPFFYHVGMDALKRTIDLSNQPFSVVSGTDKELFVEVDVLEVLANVDLRTENETHTFNNMPLATKIADNFPASIVME